MAISDEMWIIGMGILFIYIVLYQKNKIFGNIAFMCLSIALLSFSTNTITSVAGIIMLLASIASLIYDWAKDTPTAGRYNKNYR